MHLWLLRHGRAEQAVDGLLTPQGMEEAECAAERLSTAAITHLLSSPLLRALDTAVIVSQRLGNLPVQVWPELREGFSWQHQAWRRDQLVERYPAVLFPPGFAESGWLHGDDTYESVLTRSGDVAARLVAEFKPDDRVLIVAHGGLTNALLHALLRIPAAVPAWFEMDYGAISRVRLVPTGERAAWPLYPPVEVEILALNDVSHLPSGSQESSRQ